jgi:uncharacterized protein YdhG (YjbR/CyaY superfamily)
VTGPARERHDDHSDTDTVDGYIEAAPEPARPLLREIRRLILAAVPSATEKISYGMPSYEFRGQRLVHFAAAKSHVGIYGLVHEDADVPAQLAEYLDHRSTLRLRFDLPPPSAALTAALRSKVKKLEMEEPK